MEKLEDFLMTYVHCQNATSSQVDDHNSVAVSSFPVPIVLIAEKQRSTEYFLGGREGIIELKMSFFPCVQIRFCMRKLF